MLYDFSFKYSKLGEKKIKTLNQFSLTLFESGGNENDEN